MPVSRNSPTNPSDKPVPKMEWYEQKITDVSALLSQYIKEAGGYGTKEGNRFSFLLHEINGAFGVIHSTIGLLKIEKTALEASSLERFEGLSRRILEKKIQYRLHPETINTFEPVADDVVAIVDDIIKLGWVPPTEVARIKKL